MKGDDDRVEQIVRELLEKPLSKSERMALLRELVREEKTAPDQLLEAALSKLMDRLAE